MHFSINSEKVWQITMICTDFFFSATSHLRKFAVDKLQNQIEGNPAFGLKIKKKSESRTTGTSNSSFCERTLKKKLAPHPSSPKAIKRPCFGKIFCAAGNFLKNQVKKAVFGHFLENFDKKIAFFLARAPPQNKYISAPKAPLEKF